MALPVVGCADQRGDHDVHHHGLSPTGTTFWNLEWQALYEAAIRRREGKLTAHGVLMAETGERTGRSPNDKFVVKDDENGTGILALLLYLHIFRFLPLGDS